MEVMEAIKTRRSIRRYKPDPVKEDDLQAVLEAVQWAPSWANTQCWRFIVVRDSGMKERLADTLSSGNPATLAIKEAPVVIVACAETKKSGYKKGEPVTEKDEWWYMFDVGIAMQNLVLTAHALGLGTVHVGSLDAKKAADVLGLPPEMMLVEMTPLGYPDEEARAPRRKELSEFVSYDRYSQS